MRHPAPNGSPETGSSSARSHRTTQTPYQDTTGPGYTKQRTNVQYCTLQRFWSRLASAPQPIDVLYQLHWQPTALVQIPPPAGKLQRPWARPVDRAAGRRDSLATTTAVSCPGPRHSNC